MTDQDESDDEAPAGVPDLGGVTGGRLSGALETSLAALQVADTDRALAALLALYAREIDGADAMAARANRVARDVAAEHGRESALYEQVQALQAGLSKRTAIDRIGARLHAGLVEMLGTPKSRGAKSGPGTVPADDEPVDPGANRRKALELLQGGEA